MAFVLAVVELQMPLAVILVVAFVLGQRKILGDVFELAFHEREGPHYRDWLGLSVEYDGQIANVPISGLGDGPGCCGRLEAVQCVPQAPISALWVDVVAEMKRRLSAEAGLARSRPKPSS